MSLAFQRTGGRDFGNAYAIIAIEYDDFSARHQTAVEQHIDRILHLAVEIDDRSGDEIEHFAQQQAAAAKAQRYGQLDVHEQVKFHLARFRALGER